MSANNNQKKTDSKAGMIALIAAACILVLVLVLIIIESINKCNYTFINNTDKKITNLEVWLEDEEGIGEYRFAQTSVDIGEKVKGKFEAVDASDKELYMVVYVTFEDGKELAVYDGDFSTYYDGNIKLDFYKEKDQYMLFAKAGVGLFNNTGYTDVNTRFSLDLDTAEWDYVY